MVNPITLRAAWKRFLSGGVSFAAALSAWIGEVLQRWCRRVALLDPRSLWLYDRGT